MVQYEGDNLLPTLADLAEIEWKKAFEQGLEQGKKNIALAMIEEGSEVEFIARMTKLSVAEVENLKEAHR